MRLKTRSGLDWTTKFPAVKKALEALPVVTAFLDGEVVAETDSGTPSFAALQDDLSQGRSDRFRYYAFDLLHLDGVDLNGASLLDRKAALARLLGGLGDGPISYSEHFAERGDIVLRHACRLSLEGIVSKLGRSPYRSGRAKSWLKSKCTDSGEFVIIGYVPSTTQRRGDRLAGARLSARQQARLCRPRRLGLLERGGGRPVAAAGRHPAARACPGCAAARRRAPQRALDEAHAGGGGRDSRPDGRRHPAPRRVQGPAPGQAGRRRRPGEAHREPQARDRRPPSA